MTTPSPLLLDRIRAELHATIDRLIDRWPIIAELRGAPDRPRVDCERRAGPAHMAGTGWLHNDPTGDQAFNPAATWQTDLQHAIAKLGRLDIEAKRIAGDTDTATHCPVCREPIGRRDHTTHNHNRYHTNGCYTQARQADFKPARW